jgi:hypothetical protein
MLASGERIVDRGLRGRIVDLPGENTEERHCIRETAVKDFVLFILIPRIAVLVESIEVYSQCNEPNINLLLFGTQYPAVRSDQVKISKMTKFRVLQRQTYLLSR